MKGMEAKMLNLRKKLRKAVEEDKSLRLNSQEVGWIEGIINNGWYEDMKE